MLISAAPPVDPLFSSVVLLLHFEGITGSGVTGSGTLTDSSSKAHTFTSNNNTQLYQNTTQAKFGASSLFGNATDYTLPITSADWQFGTADFTIECWSYTCVAGTGNPNCIFSTQPQSGSSPFGLTLSINYGLVGFQISGEFGANRRNFTGAVDNGGWNFVTLNRVSGAWVGTWNGLVLTQSNAAGDGLPASRNLTNNIAKLANFYNNATGTGFLGGFIDELRITKGTARQSGAHAVPTAAFADQ